MKLIVCVDNKNGMMFFKKRQSQDMAVLNKISKITNGATIYTTAYSQKLLDGLNVVVCKKPFDECKNGFVFCEDFDIDLLNVNEIFVFCWNRNYPADKFFNVDLKQFKMVLKTDFVGNSHPKITLTQYKKDLS